MPERITADELANIIKLLAAQGPLPMLTHSDWGRIIAALREMEAREKVEWKGYTAFQNGEHAGAAWPSRDRVGQWAWEVDATDIDGFAPTEAEARAAVERAVLHG